MYSGIVRLTGNEMTAIKKIVYCSQVQKVGGGGMPHHPENYERALRLAAERDQGREIARETARKLFLWFSRKMGEAE